MNRRTLVALSLVLVLILGMADLMTGVEPSFVLIYSLPIWLGAWNSGRRWAITLAAISCVFRAIASRSLSSGIIIWDATSTFGVLTMIGLLVARQYEYVQRERGRLEKAVAQLRHSERLNVLGTLSAGVAHEIGTPLNVITLSAQRLTDPLIARTRAGQLVDMIVAQATKIGAIVQHLLEFGRRAASERAEVDLCELAQRSVELVATAARRYHCQVDVTSQTPARVRANAAELEQVISNLVLNAMQAMPQGGAVHVTTGTEMRRDDQGCERQFASLAVVDQGTGIAEHDLPHIFDPFYTTKPPGEGTGLGLSVSYGIVTELGGAIEVASQRGQGTTFTVLLPAI
jgi:signal transduction histidine kinase